MIKKPLISVVMPVYNVDNYLADTLKSIIRQNIGFEDNIQIVLINDGSKDESEAICLKYQKQYPKNISYIKQRNQGVSSARNNGLKKATGTYVHFMDSDDIISTNFYKESVKFLDKHSQKIDFVASKIRYFDAKFSGHYLNWKFNKDRVIDVIDEPHASMFHLPTTLIKREATKGLLFDTELSVTEDAKYLSQVLLAKKSYGVVKAPTFFYRSRKSRKSAVSGKLLNKKYFTNTPTRALEFILEEWSDKNNILKYAQHMVLNDIAWKIKEEKKQSVLSKKEESEYKNTIYSLVKKIDDDVILSNRILDIKHKLFLLRKKYGKSFDRKIEYNDGTYSLSGQKLVSITGSADYFSAVYDFIEVKKNSGKVFLEGFITQGPVSNYDTWAIRTSQGLFPVEMVDRPHQTDSFLGDAFFSKPGFKVTVDVDINDKIEFLYITSSGDEFVIPISARQFTGLSMLSGSYVVKSGLIFTKHKHSILVSQESRKKRLIAELRFDIRIMLNLQARRSYSWLKDSLSNLSVIARYAGHRAAIKALLSPVALLLRSFISGVADVLIRTVYFMGLYDTSRPVWIISDRGMTAGDNGEALFRYINEKEKPNADIYFAISKKSKDYRRIRQYGRVINVDSFRYKILFLRSRLIISSAADHYVYNAFSYRWNHFIDLYKFDFVFLQHGIIKDDLSSWLNRFEKNIKIFVTSSKPEYDSVVQGNYSYDASRVLLSGLPRYDYLSSEPENVVMLAPTWRHDLLEETRHDNTGIRARSDAFKETEYFKFYNGLMNDSRIISALNETGMVGELYLHPAFSVQAEDFTENDRFVVKKIPYDYREAFSKSNLLITDYSSVAFDFAYLKKPVIYVHFDKDSLYESHIYEEGYFSYEKDGFGPVFYDYETSVKGIVDAIHDSKMNSVYMKKVDKFFKYKDKSNSQRVFRRIMELERVVL